MTKKHWFGSEIPLSLKKEIKKFRILGSLAKKQGQF